MRQSPGYEDHKHHTHVCKLDKALYGLKQVPWAWHARLSMKLYELGFNSLKADTSLSILRRSGFIIHILIYVDDIIIASSSSKATDKLIQ